MPASLLEFLAGGLFQAGWGTLALYLLVATQLTIFSVTLYLHRSQAHRGVDFHPLVAHVVPFLDVADHVDDHQGVGRDPSQAPRQVRDRGRSAQPDAEGHPHRVLARRRAVPRSARPARGHREVRQGLPGRLDRAPPLYAARDHGPDRCCCSSASRCSASPASRCGRCRCCGSRSGPPASSTASATGGATATSRPTTPRPTSPRGASGSAARNCTTTTTRSRARRSSRCASGKFDIGWAAIRMLRDASAWRRCCASRRRWTCARTSTCPMPKR